MLADPAHILLLGNHRQALPVARDLHALGWYVTLGQSAEDSSSAFARSSAIDQVWRHPPIDNCEDFLPALTQLLSSNQGAGYVLPLGTKQVLCIDALRARLPQQVKLLLPNTKAIRACADKSVLLRLAKELDVPVANFCVTETVDQLRNKLDALRYPSVIKPIREGQRINGQKAIIAHTPDELSKQLTPAVDPSLGCIIQKQVIGDRNCLYFFAANGEVLATAQMLVNRTDRADGTGYAVHATSVPVSQRWFGFLQRLVDHVDYSGFGSLQFIQNPGTGEDTLIEINARLGGNHAGLEMIGMHQVRWAIEMETTGTASIPRPFKYPLDATYRWFTGDLGGLLCEFRSGNIDRHSALQWLTALPKTLVGTGHLVWSWRDPLPAVFLFSRMLVAEAGRSISRISRRARRALERNPVRRLILKRRSRQQLLAAASTNGVDPRSISRAYDYHPYYPRGRAASRQQRPRSLFPGISAQPVHDGGHFRWSSLLEENYEDIRNEVVSLRDTTRFKPHHQGLASQGNWDTLYFQTGGSRVEETHQLCPRTSQLLSSIPIAGSSGQVYISVLSGGTHIGAHCGPTNVRLRCHFGISIPENCCIRVDSEIVHWQEGRCIFFDDSFEHEVWNRSRQERIVLIIDVWHPDLTEEERWAIETLALGSKHIRSYREAVGQ